ncbi:MAG: hypothetical protein KA214_09550 [Neisseriaceae bacterium]|nr:hypothetical protein [Neisseriaceae bacterium]
MTTQPHHPQQDDEIDLFELFAVLWRKKIFILLTTLVFILLGFAYVKTATPVWHSEAKVIPAKVKDLGLYAKILSVEKYYNFVVAMDGTKQRLDKDINVDLWLDNNLKTYLNLMTTSTNAAAQDENIKLGKGKGTDVASFEQDPSKAFYIVKHQASSAEEAQAKLKTALATFNQTYLNRLLQNKVDTLISERQLLAKEGIQYNSNLNALTYLGNTEPENINGSIYTFLQAPTLEVSKDKPKGLIILVLSALVGGFIASALVLLQNALHARRIQE